VATLRSTTIIITIATTISTAMSAARDKVIGSTIRNTAEMHPMGTGKQPISLAVRGLEIVPAVRVASVVPEDPAVRVVLESPAVLPVALVVQEDRVVPAARVVSENPAVPVALELQTVPVAVRARVIVPGAGPGLAIVRAAGQLQHAPVVAVPVLGHRHVQPAIPLRTKSVTAAHRPDLVPLLEAEEDLAAVAETTREPAAAEAVTAWAAAE